ncbi:MAG: hypothetical protein ACLFM2_06625 [Halothece sp.]
MKPETKRKKRIAKNQLALFELDKSMTEQDYLVFLNNVQDNILDHLKNIQQADEDLIEKYQNLSRQELESLVLQGKMKLHIMDPQYDEDLQTYTQSYLIGVAEPLD